MHLQDTINGYISSIIRIAFDNLPVKDGWKKFDIDVAAVRTMITMSAHYDTDDGKRISFNPKYPSNNNRSTDLSFIFLDLREAMYGLSPEDGAWFSCNIEVGNDGSFSTSYNYNEKPDFKYWPVKEKFLDDLKRFPRKEESIPGWLRLAMAGKIK